MKKESQNTMGTVDRPLEEYPAQPSEFGMSWSAREPSRAMEFLYMDALPDSEVLTVKGNGYHLNDFLQYHDQDFIRYAYLAILHREPDPAGYQYYLSNLRNAALTKAEILGRLRYSREGRQKGTKIKRLFPNYIAQTLFRIPIIGYLLRLLVAVFELPVFMKNYQQLDVYTHTQWTQLSQYLNRTTGSAQSKINEIIADLTASLESLANIEADRSRISTLDRRLESLSAELQQKIDELNAVRRDLDVLQESISDKPNLEDIEDLLRQKAEKNGGLNLFEQLTASKADLEFVDRIEREKVDRSELESRLTATEKLHQDEFFTFNQKLTHMRRTLAEQERKLWLFLEEARKRMPEPFAEEQIENLLGEQDHLLDAMYTAFEDQFRGTRYDIKDRLKIYIPYIESAGAGSEESPVVDLGCGRGEWIETLKEQNLKAVGVDRNRIMLRQCRELNLEVVESDAIQFLREQNANTLGAVTGHHIIEHLGLETLISLLDQCYRTLKPGGILIFETPNPENLLVGAYTFYFDPTHKTPLVPDSVKFLVEQRGFSDTEILRLNRYSDICRITDRGNDFRNKWFYSEMDFAIIGYKP